MSRIADLIAQLCPAGVRFERLGELGARNKGTAITAERMRAIHLEDGPIRVFAGGQTIADVAEKSVPEKDVVRVPSIIVKSRGNIGFTYYERPFTHKAELWSYSIRREDVDQKFVYYYLLTRVTSLQEIARGASVKLPQLGVKDTDTLGIPLPPLEIQREIVRVLDALTDMEAALEEELQARGQQYRYYRDLLLDCSNATDIEYATLGQMEDAGKIKLGRGNVISKQDLQAYPGEHPVYSSSAAGNGEFGRYGRYMFEDERISWSVDGGGRFFYRQPHKYSVTNVCGWLKVLDTTVLSTKYLFYALDSLWATKRFDYTRKAHPSVIRDEYTIAIPSLEQQSRVVEMIDKFETLVSSVHSGLPAEIGARRQQYVYYLDHLLAFKEAA